jgi:UDP-N-acetylmuramyl pentapeptide phosphotransferase/UDP-N-acetylglucosamine-1-phosphate transferase
MSLAPLMAIMLIPGSIFQWGSLSMSWFVGGGITILFLLGSINGVNFMDGQNGLASGSAAITFVAIATLSFLYKDTALFYISLTLIAAMLGFLIFNYPYARIFLGDSGAYLSGFLTALLAILFLQRNTNVAPLTAVVLLIYPLWEVVFSTVRKVLFDRISPLQSDRNHLHQLIYRHYGGGRGYVPTLLLLPAQATVSLLTCFFAGNNGVLLLLAFLFVTLYCGVYFYERTFATKRDRTKITLNKH